MAKPRTGTIRKPTAQQRATKVKRGGPTSRVNPGSNRGQRGPLRPGAGGGGGG